VTKESDDVRFAVTSYLSEQADPEALLELARGHWSIENGNTTAGIGLRTRIAAPSAIPDSTQSVSVSIPRTLSLAVARRPPGRDDSLRRVCQSARN
jgi:hypothetical protein